MSERHPHIVNVAELEPDRNVDRAPKFACRGKSLGGATGARGIGCTWYEVPPGRAAFPFHFHCANEEAMFVLEGEGTLRLGADTRPIKAGDYVTFPTGPDLAHQIINSGQAPLRYLALSTMVPVEVVGYPDSNKFGTWAASPAGKLWQRSLFRDSLDYYDGEG